MVVFLVTGFFLPVTIVALVFLGPTGAVSIECSKAFYLCVPSIMLAGFSPGLVLEGIGGNED